MTHVLKRSGGVFGTLHREVIGEPLDLSALRPEDHPPALVEIARRAWQGRVQTEFRSVQIMTRFLTEVLGAGDPLDIYAGAIDLVADEVRHTELCMAVCRGLGAPPVLPDPIELRDPEIFLKAPMPERALNTAISMLCVSETISVGFVADLRARCEYAPIRAVLDATLADEEHHDAFGWSYVKESLRRFPPSTLASWRILVEKTLEPHHAQARKMLASVPNDRRSLDAWPDAERVGLGLFSPERQALVFERTLSRELLPKLRELELA